MKKARIVILLSALVIATYSYGQTNAKAVKTKSKAVPSSKLIGTWRIIEYADFDPVTRKWFDRYGHHPRGYFTYTKSGIVNINISTDSPMKVSEDSAKNMNVNYHEVYKSHSFGYFGNYTVDWEKSVVTHHVKGGSLLWYIDTDQPRSFKLKNDTLLIGDDKTTRRVLVRAD